MTTKNDDRRYRATINRGGALLADTKRFLSNWDSGLDLAENMQRTLRENILAKRSRAQTQEVLYQIRNRYFADESVGRGLVALAREPELRETLERLLYYLTACADPVIYDTVTEFLQLRYATGFAAVSPVAMREQVQEWVTEGRTHVPWNAETTERVAQGLLATLRDFGVMTGVQNKQITPPYLPDAAFALIAFLISKTTRSGEKTVMHPDWRLFFLDRSTVERFFVTAHQLHYLTYAAAGNVVRIDFPACSFDEVIHVIAARSS
jgi:Putative inner membrane protein (DUF1819)